MVNVMTSTATELDSIMERASEALAGMQYLACEEHCLRALALARHHGDWAYYARILLPLQETRRQRRMIAAEGVTRLGTAGLQGPLESWLGRMGAGCIVVTGPHETQEAIALHRAARKRGQCIEVLFADNPATASRWTLLASAGEQSIKLTVAAPQSAWIDQWLAPTDAVPVRLPAQSDSSDAIELGSETPVDWFLDACEALGEVALATVKAPLGERERIEQLERCLEAVPDHEIIHQALGEAARAMRGVSN